MTNNQVCGACGWDNSRKDCSNCGARLRPAVHTCRHGQDWLSCEQCNAVFGKAPGLEQWRALRLRILELAEMDLTTRGTVLALEEITSLAKSIA